MKYQHLLAISAVMTVLLSVLIPAYAAHSGIHGVTKTSTGALLPDTKVTAEKVNFYDYRRSAAGTATYSFNYGSGSTYLMAAMKNDYKYTKDWNVSPPVTKDWSLPSRTTYTDIKYKLVTDQNFRTDHPAHETDANTLTLVAAEPWFKEEHTIKLVKHSYDGTFQRTTTNCDTLKTVLFNNYATSGAEGALLIVGKNVNLVNNAGESVEGCVTTPQTSSFPIVIVKEYVTDPAKLTMHEVSHNYGLSHVREGLGNPSIDFKTVMHKYINDPMSIKNWSPTEDDTLETQRTIY
ncbi:MAG: hypothetical protein QXW37_06420 [Candidatus Nitrosotenuis sp.]